jgi:hypothetical protein
MPGPQDGRAKGNPAAGNGWALGTGEEFHRYRAQRGADSQAVSEYAEAKTYTEGPVQ